MVVLLRTLLYRPQEIMGQIGTDGRPLVIFIHGGGFVYGSPEMETQNAVGVVQAYGCIAICLSYRLAPEYKFPTATDDCWDAFKWVRFDLMTSLFSSSADPVPFSCT
jgi:Esterase/lipase